MSVPRSNTLAALCGMSVAVVIALMGSAGAQDGAKTEVPGTQDALTTVIQRVSELSFPKLVSVLDKMGVQPSAEFYNCLCPAAGGYHYSPGPTGPCRRVGPLGGITWTSFKKDPESWKSCMSAFGKEIAQALAQLVASVANPLSECPSKVGRKHPDIRRQALKNLLTSDDLKDAMDSATWNVVKELISRGADVAAPGGGLWADLVFAHFDGYEAASQNDMTSALWNFAEFSALLGAAAIAPGALPVVSTIFPAIEVWRKADAESRAAIRHRECGVQIDREFWFFYRYRKAMLLQGRDPDAPVLSYGNPITGPGHDAWLYRYSNQLVFLDSLSRHSTNDMPIIELRDSSMLSDVEPKMRHLSNMLCYVEKYCDPETREQLIRWRKSADSGNFESLFAFWNIPKEAFSKGLEDMISDFLVREKEVDKIMRREMTNVQTQQSRIAQEKIVSTAFCKEFSQLCERDSKCKADLAEFRKMR